MKIAVAEQNRAVLASGGFVMEGLSGAWMGTTTRYKDEEKARQKNITELIAEEQENGADPGDETTELTPTHDRISVGRDVYSSSYIVYLFLNTLGLEPPTLVARRKGLNTVQLQFFLVILPIALLCRSSKGRFVEELSFNYSLHHVLS
jgi:hypothetical protein